MNSMSSLSMTNESVSIERVGTHSNKSGNTNKKLASRKMSSRHGNTKPTLITAEQRRTNKMKILQAENIKLRERINRLEMLYVTNNNTSIEHEAILRANQFEPLMDANMNIEVEETTPITNPVVNRTFDKVKQAIKRKNESVPETTKRVAKNVQPNNTKMVGETNIENKPKGKEIKKKEVKPPPLHIHNQRVQDTLQLVKGAQIKTFEIRRVSNEKHSVILNSIEDYDTVNNVLKEVNTKYFTYTPKNLKLKSLVLKGLTEDEDISELKADLECHENVKISKIIQMTSKRPTEKGRKLPLYIVQFEANINMANITKIKAVNYQRIAWETLQKQNDVMQCRKCQRFGHAATNCNLGYRCVKCDGQHNPGECPITTEIERKDIYCANCQKMGHPASFKGCPVYQQMLAKLKNKIREKQLNTPRTFKSVPVNVQNGSYADMLKPKPSHPLSVESLAIKIEKMADTIQQQSEQITKLLNIINAL